MNMPLRRARPYVFWGQTTSLCETCLTLVPAKIVIEGNDVFYLKRCREHGAQKTLIATDAAYFKSCKEFIKPGDLPLQYQSRTHYGCPYDCGLCPDHEQHSCLALIEINDECNLSCPVCFADSSPQRTRHRSLAELEEAGVATVSFPSVALFAAAQAVRQVARKLQCERSLASVGDALLPLEDYYGLVGLRAMLDREEGYDRAAASLTGRNN